MIQVMERPRYVAHTRQGEPQSSWEPLEDHLQLVADGNDSGLLGSALFAEAFGAADWGRVAGLWHDAGKYSKAFQAYLNESAMSEHSKRGTVDHSTAGAQLAMKQFGNNGYPLAYVIAGHHAGLADYAGGQSGIAERLKKLVPEIPDAFENFPPGLIDLKCPATPKPFESMTQDTQALGLRVAFFVRMLFSCLVDADFLATEWYMDQHKSEKRPSSPVAIDKLLNAFDAHMSKLSPVNPRGVDLHRAELLAACRFRGQDSPGLFSITAPTGVGKTLSSLAFALEHAKAHGLRRIVYALPFTSVTEQVAEVFREVFKDLGDNIVLEHHSSASWKSADEMDSHAFRVRLAAENWDAQVIVTTNVQLLESLFGSRSSQCRKLHRLAQSVIVFDEAQALPVHLIEPTLVAIDELQRGYGASIVLCSATMPALTYRDGFEIGLKNVREIVPDPSGLAQEMRRVELSSKGDLEDEELIEQLADQDQVLAVFNTKGHAAEVYRGLVNRLGLDGVWHLSASMCPEHRSLAVDEIKKALKSGQPCRVVSTQVIEAGVDIDFPMVYRAMAGLDSIVQAAGRCNRNGRMKMGQVILFDTDNAGKTIKQQGQTTKEIAAIHDDLFSLDAIEHYFRLHLWQRKSEWDKHDIASKDMFDANGFVFHFRKADEKYQVIEEYSVPIVVPFGKHGAELIAELQDAAHPSRALLRKTQRFCVSVPKYKLDQLIDRGACATIHEHTTILIDEGLYDQNLGLVTDGESGLPEYLNG